MCVAFVASLLFVVVSVCCVLSLCFDCVLLCVRVSLLLCLCCVCVAVCVGVAHV